MELGPALRKALPGGGFFSTSFGQPLGSLIHPAIPRGYYIDLRVKAVEPDGPPPSSLHVVATQWGLGAHERWLHGTDERWLAAAIRVADGLVARLDASGGLVHEHPYPHTFRLRPPWLSAMAQGQAASLLVRVHAATGEDRFAAAARRVLEPYRVDSRAGGVRAELDGAPFYEEYPTRPPSYVLNGGIYAVWGLLDVALALGDGEARAEYETALDGLAVSLGRWDRGWWSLYDLYPHRVPNLASPAYHELHIDQLRALMIVSPRAQIGEMLERFERYARSRALRARAFAGKVAFRLTVPRGRRAT